MTVPVACQMPRSETVYDGHPRARKKAFNLQVQWSARHDNPVPKLIVRVRFPSPALGELSQLNTRESMRIAAAGQCDDRLTPGTAVGLAASTAGRSPNIGHRRRGWHAKSSIEHFDRFYRSLQCESTHCYCELIEEADLPN
jgi:hypothetical protein